MVDGYEDKYYYGRRATVFTFRVTETSMAIKRLPPGFGYQGGASRQGYNRSSEESLIGADLKQA